MSDDCRGQWREDLFWKNINREAERIYDAPHLSYLEQETYCRAIQIVADLVMLARSEERGFRLDDEHHAELRSTLKKIEAVRSQNRKELNALTFLYPLNRDQPGEIIEFPSRETKQ